MARTAGCCLLLALAARAPAQGDAAPSIPELVYRLVDPRGRLLVQEELLAAKGAAVPHLTKAIAQRNSRAATGPGPM